MFRDISGRAYPLFVTGKHFAIVHDWRDVLLCLPGRVPLSVGTHFEEPRSVVIASNGLWCASGGCGVVIYHLHEPYLPFTCGVESDQWWEIGRDEDDPWFVDDLRVIGGDGIRIYVAPESRHRGVYEANLTNRSIRRRGGTGRPPAGRVLPFSGPRR